jgi:hypothetical protein
LGSFFAGVKAGTLGGILYAGGLGGFAVLVLFVFKSQVIAYISQPQEYAMACGVTGSSTNSTALEQCFSSQLALFVPVMVFLIFFVVLFWSALFGIWYERLPGGGPVVKGEELAAIMAVVSFLVVGLPYGYAFDYDTNLATGAFLIGWTALFGYALARLYCRYTRVVTLESQDPDLLRVLVDGHDFTGRSRTFALTSSHKLKAELADDASFRGWEVTGGLNVEDVRSFETVVEVNGPGTLKGMVTRKY